ncbi:MAG: FixH family protein [Gammaproteobacteria bacterium]|nr:FixH family protein [Gammaproteobacteria bacterium]
MIGWLALVAVVLLANVTMVVLAVTTSPGLVVEDYYERGRAYAETRAAQKLAHPDTWEVRLDLPQPVRLGIPVGVRVAAKDERGLPVHAERARFFAYRPSDAKADFEQPMVTEAPGVVGAEVTFPLPGIWDLIVQVESGDKVYDMARRIAVRRD